MRCFRLLSSMCRTSEIDGRCVNLRGSDRCEISYAATLTRSMFEDPIDVNFIIMLLYSCTRITPRFCTLLLFINAGDFQLCAQTWDRSLTTSLL